MVEVYGLTPFGTLAPLYEPSEVGYKIRVGNLSGRGDSDTLDAKVCVPLAPAAVLMAG